MTRFLVFFLVVIINVTAWAQPTVIVSSSATDPTNVSPIPVTITFSEDVTGFEEADISVSNGTAVNFLEVNPSTYTADITPSAAGLVTVTVPAGVAVDISANGNLDSNILSITYDNAPPAVVITSTATDPTNDSPFTVNITFDESVTGLDVGEITVTNGTAGNLSGSGTTYTADITPAGAGAITVSVAAGAAADAATNGNTASNILSRTFDNTSPSVAVSSAATDPTNVSPFTVTITFDESVTGLDVSEITVTNGSAGNLSGSGTTYTADITPTGAGLVTVSVLANLATDAATNGNTASNILSRTFDNVSPTVTITSTASEPTSVSPIPVTITFSESVTGFVVGDINVTNGTTGGFVPVSGTVYTVNITPSAAGLVTVTVPANAATDAATNGNTVSNTLSRTFDNSDPTVVITSTATDPTSVSPIPVTITFSESVTGFVVGDINVTNGTAGGFVPVSGTVYTVNITPSAAGLVTVTVPANAATDAATNGNTVSNTLSRTFDNSDPTVVISSTATDPTSVSPIPVTITFSESVTGFVVGDINVTNGTAGGFVPVSGTVYTVNITPSAAGLVTISVAAGAAADAATNGNTASNILSRTFDNTSPSVVVSSTATNPTSVSPIPVTITFSESVTGFVVGDINVTNGTAGGFVPVSGTVYTVNITPSAAGLVTISVAAGAAADAATNGNTVSNTLSRTFDNSDPTVVITSTATNPTNVSPFPVTITFSESVTGFVVGDINVTNGTASGFVPVSGTVYTVNITPSAAGLVTITVPANAAADAATNGNTVSNTLSRTFDNVAPTVTITSTATEPTSVSPIPVTITFSESVTGFIVGDINVTNGTAGGFVPVSGTVYTVNITPSADGLVTVTVPANAATDAATNGNTVSNILSRTFDNSDPTVVISSTATDPTSVSPIPVTITFSESVTGFVVGDINVTNGTAGGFVPVSGTVYTVNITPSADGLVTVTVPANAATDAATNGNTVSNTLSRTFDNSDPTVVISSAASSPTNVSPIPVTITFSESVTGFVVGDINVTNGTAGGFVPVSGTVYTVNITPSAAGLVTVTVPANTATDAATNGNTVSNTLSRTFDNSDPTVVITSTATNPTNVSPFPVTITFSESVTGFVVGDINVTNGTAGGFVPVSGTVYTVNITPSAAGLVTVTVPANAATDAATNGNTVSNTLSRTFDNVSPTVTITSTATEPTSVSPIPVTITFSESVSGFIVGDINVTNGTAGGFVPVSGTVYTVNITPSAGGLVTVTVPANVATDAATNGNTSSAAGFTYIPPPTITSFNPSSAASGVTVTINGTNFTGASAVSFGGIAAASFTVVNATQITAVVAAGGASGNVSVTTPGGTHALAGFTFLPTPTVSSFLPLSGAAGVSVTIAGTNFSTVQANNTVRFNGTIATVTGASATSLTATVPVGASSGKISATVSGVTGTSVDDFTVLPTPVISGFSPSSGAVGATVTITGVNFGTITNLAFNGTPAIVNSSTSTSITTTVPSGATTGEISFTTNGLDLVSLTNFTVLASPTITGFNPVSGAPGAIVIITGTNFSPAPSVSFNGISSPVISSNATSITTSVPSGASSGPISVTTRGVTITSAGSFTVLASPTVTGFSPGSGARGAIVTITGTNFSVTPSENIVSFNGIIAFVSSSTATSITATVPLAATSGTISIVVSGVTITSSTSFIVLPTPTISNANPNSGAVGATVVISGTNFSASPLVSFNGTPATVTASNATSITTTVPIGAVTGPIAVTTSGVTINSAFNFTVLPSPSISGFNPTSGAVGAAVTISGANFSTTPGNHIVTFNGITAAVTGSTTSSITTTVPAGASTGKISVTVSGVTVTSTDDFTVLPTPNISGFSPTAAAVGATITISGNNFSTIIADNVILFNGVTALVTASSVNSITTSVPVGAGTGLISLTVNGVTVFSSSNFTVLPTPTITGFSPASGAVGANVIITGTSFSASPAVTFNGTSASVISSTATTITTTVPAGASSGLIAVTTSGITVNSSSGFNVLPSPSISGFSPASGAIGATVIISGSNFGSTPGDHVVRFNTTTAVVTAASPTSLTAIVPAGATIGKISVTVSGVTVVSTNDFVILPSPTITGFSPSSGAVGAIVTINGSNFNTPPTVNFNGTAATVTSYTPTSITTAVPSGATTGAVAVTVNGVEITSGSVFTVLPTPLITSFNPSSGAVGASVNISGNNFNTAPIVSFNGTIATVSSSTTSSIATTVPAGATTGLITITVNGININSGSVFTVLPTPAISSFTPTSGAANAVVTINGSNFNASPLVSFNGVSATVLSSTASSITVVVPEGTSTGKISVTTGGVTILSVPNFTVLPTPTITNFTPTSGAVGATVTINGTNFGSTPVVQFNGITAVVSASNATSITTSVPTGAGTGPISVITSGVTIPSASNFTVLPSPTITGFSPGSGAVGTPVIITGTNFSAIAANNVVRFNNTLAVVISSTSSSITATVPAGATTGNISVAVSGVTIFSASNFTVLPSPTITSFSPSAAGVGVTVTISGTNFISAPLVEFNGTPAVVSSYNSTSITTTVPSGAGTGPISVSLSGVTVLSSSNFTVFGTPSITGFSPNNGVYGVSVTISGSNFSATAANNTVEFNGVPATVISSTTSSITTTVPVGATTGPISVTVNGITGNSAMNFTVPTPTITSFSPTSGAVGASVTLTGTNFTNTDANNIVRFNGITAVVTAATTTSITVTVPASASTGKISVTVGGVPGTSATDFTVLPTPTIIGFTPTSGAVGAAVTISGTNFSPNPTDNIVRFNGITAVVTAATTTSITVTVPAGASTGKISVTVSAVTISSVPNFTVLATPTITGFSPASGAVGASVIITGTNFSTTPSNNLVEFNNVAAIVTASTTTSITATVPVGATTGKISITVSGINLISTTNFTVLPTPTLTGFTPNNGAAGTPVTITGTNFSTSPLNNTVLFNGIASVVTASTTNSLATTVPVGASTGPISVIVSGITLTGGTFNVLPTPAITGLSPASGAEGATIVIMGTNFSATPSNNIVAFNGVTAVIISSTPTSITTTVPDGATTGKISLTLNGITVYSANNFMVLATPTLSGFNPSTGAPGATVTITGTNFSTTEANNVVIFNGTTANVSNSTTTTITTTVPVGATTGPITVTVSGITLTSTSNFNVLPSPAITKFTPSSGAVGAEVTIDGVNFGATPGSNIIRFNNNITATTLTASPTRLTTRVPTGATTGKITVTTSGVTVSSATDFTVLPRPTLTGFSPASASVGAIVTISGTNFNTPIAENIVVFNGMTAEIISMTTTSIRVYVPNNAVTGPISVTVNGITLTTSTNFIVLPTPTIVGFTPSSSAVTATITITGTNFNPTPANNVVKFNGVTAVVTSSSATSITVIVPIGATNGNITVTVNGVTISSPNIFTVLPTPIISGFSPISGAVGANVTVTGTNFGATAMENVVKFNGVTALISEATSTSIKTQVPVGASTGKISVTASGVTVNSATNFTVMPSPSITSFNPMSGLAGSIVNIIGLNFSSDETLITVTFNGIPAQVIASSPSLITTVVPNGATSGPISVTINGVTVSSTSNFSVIIIDTTAPMLGENKSDTVVSRGNNVMIQVRFDEPESDITNASVTFQYISNRGTPYIRQLTENGENWEGIIPWDEKIGELGVEYKLSATNDKGLNYTSPSFIPVRVLFPGNGLTIPYTSFGGDVSNYRIISVPLDLEKPSVDSVFNELPPYDKSKWRISHYDNATNSNKEILQTSPIKAGVGYWLIIKDDPDDPATALTTGAGKTVSAGKLPFTVQLKAGWNQIGNPYNFPLEWSDLVAANPGLPVAFRGFNGVISNFENRMTINRLEGGFVNVASDMLLIYPVKRNTGSRIESPLTSLRNSIDQEEWEVDFTVKQKGISNVIGGAGMRLDASEDFDIYDGFSMPRFNKYLDVNHEKKLNQYHYSKDVIPTADNHTWKFRVDASSTDDIASISWDNSYMGSNDFNLILFDEHSKVWVDMKQNSSYSFMPPGNFKLIYGTENHVKKEIGLGNARILEVSPNPSKGPINIHLFLPEWNNKFPVQLELKSLTGITLANIFSGELESGYQQFEWSGENNSNPLPSGVYLIQMRCNNQIQTVRVVLLN